MLASGILFDGKLWPPRHTADVCGPMHFKVQLACASLRRLWPIPRAGGGPGLALMIASVSKSMTAGVRRSVVAAAVAATLVGGCASGDTGAAEVWDPIET